MAVNFGQREKFNFLRTYYIQIFCCALFDTRLKKMTRVTNWQELYVSSDLLKVKIFANGFKRQRKLKQRPLANSTKLILRLLLYTPGTQCFLSKYLEVLKLILDPKVRIHREKPVKCASINVRLSLTSKVKSTNGEIFSNLQRFQNFVYTEDIDIVFANETWLSNSVDNVEMLHSEYGIFRNDREGRGGGVMLGIRTVRFKSVREIKHSYDLKVILVQLKIVLNAEILICSCYRRPNAEKIWKETFESFLINVCSRHSKIVLAGDFNLPRACWNH